MTKKYGLFLFMSCLLLIILIQPAAHAESSREREALKIEPRAIYSLQNSSLYKPIYTGVNTPIASKFGFQPRATAQTKVSLYHNGREVAHDGQKTMLNRDIIAEKNPYIIATNMGIMNGRSIDVRFTPVSAGLSVPYLENFYVGLDKNDTTTKLALLTVSDTRSADPQFKLEFLDSGTKQPVKMSGNLTIADVDNGETIIIEPVGSRVDSIYAMSDTILNTDDSSTPERSVIRAQGSADVGETDRRAWVSVAYENASQVLITYSCYRTGLFFGYQEFEEFDYVEEVVPPVGMATVDVFHKNQQGVEIAEKVQLHGVVGSIYQSQSKVIPGYKLLTTPTNAIGLFLVQTPSVTYVYEKVDTSTEDQVSVRVFHKDLAGNEIATMEVLTGTLGSVYQAMPKLIPGYKAPKEPPNRIGLLNKVNPDVTFIYEKEDNTEPDPGIGNQAPMLKLGIKEGISDGKAFAVTGIWKDDDSPSVLLFYQVDDGPRKLISLTPNLEPGTWHPFTFSVPAEEIPVGNHTLTFYAYDIEGLGSLGERITLKPDVVATLEITFQDEDGEELASRVSVPVVVKDKVDLSQLTELQVVLTSIRNQGYELISQPENELLIEKNETSIAFVFKGFVRLVDVTKEMRFNSGTIAPFDQRLHYEGVTPFKLNIQDDRAQEKPAEGFKRGQFQITGVLSKPFRHANGKELTMAKLIYFDGTAEREISTKGNEIYRNSTARPDKTYEINLSDEGNKELRLEVPKGSGVVKGSYQAEITWELIQGP